MTQPDVPDIPSPRVSELFGYLRIADNGNSATTVPADCFLLADGVIPDGVYRVVALTQQAAPLPMHHDPALVEAYNLGFEAALAEQAAPAAPNQLSPERINELWHQAFTEANGLMLAPLKFARAIEAELASRGRAQGGNTSNETTVSDACPKCVGTGSVIYDAKCSACKGTGRASQAATTASASIDPSKPCRNVLLRVGYRAVPKSCPRCGPAKECPAGHAGRAPAPSREAAPRRAGLDVALERSAFVGYMGMAADAQWNGTHFDMFTIWLAAKRDAAT